MIIYVGFLIIILCSIYTISYAKQIWKENKVASLGAVLVVFIALAVSIFSASRT